MDEQKLIDFIKSKGGIIHFREEAEGEVVEIECGVFSIFGDDLREAYDNFTVFLSDYIRSR